MLWIDWTYVYFVLPAVIFSVFASIRVQSTFDKYKKQISRSGMTGNDAARAVLDKNGLSFVRVERVAGKLTDHFDPKTNVIRLSEEVYDSSSTAAIGVAAHEAGHAVQHAEEYTPLKIRNAIVPVAKIGSQAGLILFIIGLALTAAGSRFEWLAYTGIILYGSVAVFQFVTLPTEFNASSRALTALGESGILMEDELRSSKKVLNAAALTYVAALAVTLMTIVRFIFLINGRRR